MLQQQIDANILTVIDKVKPFINIKGVLAVCMGMDYNQDLVKKELLNLKDNVLCGILSEIDANHTLGHLKGRINKDNKDLINICKDIERIISTY